MFTRTVLALAIFATGVAACGSDSTDNTPDSSISIGGTSTATSTAISPTSTTTTTSTAIPTSTTTTTTTSVGPDAGADAGDAVIPDAGAPDAPVATGPTKDGHLAIINAPAAADVTAVDVPGPTPPTYDPATLTCK
jgi:hypothetical protein